MRGFGERLGFKPTESEQHALPNSLTGWLPFPDTVAALHKLKSRYRLAIVSNIDDDLFAATGRRLALDFDHVITAQQARAYKPSLQIFKLAQRRIGVSPAKWLSGAEVAGDRPASGQPSSSGRCRISTSDGMYIVPPSSP